MFKIVTFCIMLEEGSFLNKNSSLPPSSFLLSSPRLPKVRCVHVSNFYFYLGGDNSPNTIRYDEKTQRGFPTSLNGRNNSIPF
jgi:hypothetical protein